MSVAGQTDTPDENKQKGGGVLALVPSNQCPYWFGGYRRDPSARMKGLHDTAWFGAKLKRGEVVGKQGKGPSTPRAPTPTPMRGSDGGRGRRRRAFCFPSGSSGS